MQPYHDSILVRCFTFLAELPVYAGILFWPQGLHMERSFPLYQDLQYKPGDPRGSHGRLGTIIAAAPSSELAAAPRQGILWFAAADILHTGVLFPVNAFILEHWLYLPEHRFVPWQRTGDCQSCQIGNANSLSPLRPSPASPRSVWEPRYLQNPHLG